MMDIDQTILLEKLAIPLLIALITAVVTSLITVRLSIAQFRTQKMWEVKLDTYTRLITNLHHIKDRAYKHYIEITEGREFQEEFLNGVLKRDEEANLEVLKIYSTGTFALSQEAYDALKRYIILRNNREPTYFEYVDNTLRNTDACIKEIIRISKKDLK